MAQHRAALRLVVDTADGRRHEHDLELPTPTDAAGVAAVGDIARRVGHEVAAALRPVNPEPLFVGARGVSVLYRPEHIVRVELTYVGPEERRGEVEEVLAEARRQERQTGFRARGTGLAKRRRTQ